MGKLEAGSAKKNYSLNLKIMMNEGPEIFNSETPENLEKYNPNSIGELLSMGKDLLTSPDKVYRSVKDKAAIDDIENSGVVRNKQSAGLVEKSRWGERVFWSRGGDGKYHIVQKGGYVIEAPFSIATERVVRKEDVSAIYTKTESEEVVNILDNRQKEEQIMEKLRLQTEERDQEKIREIRKKLNLE